jgi:hypothetical protein
MASIKIIMILPEFKDNKQLTLFCAAQDVEIF